MINSPAGEIHGSALFLPPFGLNLHNMFAPAFYLVNAGFRTIRFDCRNNVGASPGEICDFRLGRLIEDARAAAARTTECFGSDDFLIVGTSISASAALLLARDYPRARIFLMVPIVDLGRVVNLLSNDPGAMDAYRRRDADVVRVRNIFGHDLNAQEFCDDLVSSGVATAAELLAAARSVRGRAGLVLAGNDEYCSTELQHRLVEALGAGDDTLLLEGSRHGFGASALAARRCFAHLVDFAEAHFNVPEAQRNAALPDDIATETAGRRDREAILHHFNSVAGAGHAATRSPPPVCLGSGGEPAALQRSKEIAELSPSV